MGYGSGGYGSGGYGSGGYGSGSNGGYGSGSGSSGGNGGSSSGGSSYGDNGGSGYGGSSYGDNGGSGYGGSNSGGSGYGGSNYGGNGGSGYGGSNYGDNGDSGSNYGGSGYGSGDNGDGNLPVKGGLFKSDREKKPGYVEGVVTGYQTEVDDTGFLGAWFRSLFSGVPFVVGEQKHIFQLVTDEFNSDSACVEVHLSGQISSGKINNGEKVRVYGTTSSRGEYLAKKIVKLNNNMKVYMKNAMPAFIVRAVTLLILAVIVGIVMSVKSAVGNSEPGTNANAASLFNMQGLRLVAAGALVLAALFFGGKLRNMTGLSMKVLWIIVAVLVALLVPGIGATIAVICIMIWGIKLMVSGLK